MLSGLDEIGTAVYELESQHPGKTTFLPLPRTGPGKQALEAGFSLPTAGPHTPFSTKHLGLGKSGDKRYQLYWVVVCEAALE